MAGRQDQNGSDEKGLFGDFSVSTVIASGLAAATSFALSSKIGLAGSIIGVAIGGVASAAASQIYKSLLKASAQKLSDLTPDAMTNAAPEEAAVAAVDAKPAADETHVYRPGSLSGRSPIQEVAASGTPIAPASVRYAAHERERRVLRRRATAIAAAFAIAAVLLFALVVNVATQGAGIGSGATSSSGEATSPTTGAPAGQDATNQTDGEKATSSPEAPAKKNETTQPEKQETASPTPETPASSPSAGSASSATTDATAPPASGSQGSGAKQDKPSGTDASSSGGTSGGTAPSPDTTTTATK
mgnify:CR=1 FL=1